jgi:hypothetical protein
MELKEEEGRVDCEAADETVKKSNASVEAALVVETPLAAASAGSFCLRPSVAAMAHLLFRHSPSLRASIILTGSVLGSGTAAEIRMIMTSYMMQSDVLGSHLCWLQQTAAAAAPLQPALC